MVGIYVSGVCLVKSSCIIYTARGEIKLSENGICELYSVKCTPKHASKEVYKVPTFFITLNIFLKSKTLPSVWKTCLDPIFTVVHIFFFLFKAQSTNCSQHLI